ncbi:MULTISPECIES: type IV toxin-antitoxin system AbiEi family antitoxin domain-containing protein [unclassified Rhodococcus (in: high G+C Gram-positive bacteria)]|uniref:type IV toxin-antitoxin system AbiEi family antitoxin domain-containing protein n=1 Tax=unclassified Rhodococcus (in: high G+C Gram-positive bacteria) TaxID=192944 RepID=UPI0009E94E20|nr:MULTISPECIES: type IV toxin-antitoxin system AbiEi family antitoxin domain-containing protein [unclassified Rhodococcus (in: high G+C Gram-positive bacteria)]
MARITSRSEALAQGYTDSELRRMCRTGDLTRLRRGAYASSDDIANLSEQERHLLLARAMLTTGNPAPDTVLSHVSAAIAHGIDLWNVPLSAVHMTRNRRTGGRTGRVRHVHASPYDADEVTDAAGFRSTTVSRTIADLACCLPFDEAVCSADDAARRLGVTGTQVEEILARRPTRSGHARAHRVALFMDAGSESVGESRSRVLLRAAGFAISTQRVINCDNASYRVDFSVDGTNVIGEFDGRVKYGRLVPTGETPADVLWREKLREDALRGAGYEVVRWTWQDLATPNVVIERMQRALDRNHTPPA